MKISTLFYCIGQGIKGIFKNKQFSLASMATIGACLFLFGICFSIIFNFKYMIKHAEDGVSVQVFFKEDTSDERIADIGQLISSHSAVSKVNFVSAEQAWESFKTEYLGEYADGFTENPLENEENYEIYMNDISRQAELVSYLESIPEVKQVNRSEITANAFSGMNSLITYVSFALVGILLAVSIFLISNTVIIGISVRQEEIEIMKYVGATDFFVRSPFVIEGILIGAIGSAVPVAIIYFTYNKVIEYVVTRFYFLSRLLTFVPVTEIIRYLCPISIILGIGIGFLGSAFTVRRHLSV